MTVSPLMTIRSYEVEGGILVDTNEVLGVVKNMTVGKGSIFAPQDSIVFVQTDLIEKKLSEQFPEIDTVEVSRSMGGVLNVAIVERDNAYVYCNVRCHSVDESGFIYHENGLLEEEIDAVVFKTRTLRMVGETVISGNEMSELVVLVNNLQQENLSIKAIYDYSPQTRALITNNGTKILIPKSELYDEAFTLLKKMLTTAPFRTTQETKDFVETYEYINAQFGKKIFSCEVGAVCANNYPL